MEMEKVACLASRNCIPSALWMRDHPVRMQNPPGGTQPLLPSTQCGWDCYTFCHAGFLGIGSSGRSRRSTFSGPGRSRFPHTTSTSSLAWELGSKWEPEGSADAGYKQGLKAISLTSQSLTGWCGLSLAFFPEKSWSVSPARPSEAGQMTATRRQSTNGVPQRTSWGKVRGGGTQTSNNPTGKVQWFA